MEPQELAENTEKAHESGQRGIGLTMAIFAVLLAIATMMSHRAHTEEVLLETQATDQWNYYQAKNIRSHMYEADSKMAALMGDKNAPLATEFHSSSISQKKDAEEIQKKAQEYEADVVKVGKKAGYYDASELFLEVAIVLSSISLLAGSRMYWQGSFLFVAVGIALMLWGLLRLH
jgi:hypothetical protein